MAENKVDQREVRKIRAAVAHEGRQKAARRFDENSPEFQKAEQDRKNRQAFARDELRARRTNQEGKDMAQQQNEKRQSPAQQRSAQAKRSAAQQRAAEMKQKQQAQKTRLQQQNKQRSQSAGQSM